MKMPKIESYTMEVFETLPSTSLYLKEGLGGKRNSIVSAFSQSFGRGTKGRSFSSEEGGVYLSILTYFEDFPTNRAFEIMQNCAVSVCETLLEYEIKAKIKWPNDIFVDDKKICGILIENLFEKGKIQSSLVGIGLNVYNPLPEELFGIATTMSKALSKEFNRSNLIEVRERLIENFFKDKPNLAELYQSYIGYVGEEIFLLAGDQRIPATLLSVTDKGELKVRTEKGEEIFYSAEVSLRLKEEGI